MSITTLPTNPKSAAVEGILLLDKAQGLSSFQALSRMKRLFKVSKAGHCGSLDPLATGMLPICLGQAVKYSQFLLDADKTYEVTAMLGVKTATGDSEGEVIATHPVPALTEQRIQKVIEQFIGPQEQIPPMYSAIKIQGKRLYKYARQGQEIDRPSRSIILHDITLLAAPLPHLRLHVHCSKGTYIRVLIEDIGEALGCGAHVTALRRTSIAHLPTQAMISEEALTALEEPLRHACVQPLTLSVAHLPQWILAQEEVWGFSKGKKLPIKVETATAPLWRVYAPAGDFLGVADVRENGTLLCPKRLITSCI